MYYHPHLFATHQCIDTLTHTYMRACTKRLGGAAGAEWLAAKATNVHVNILRLLVAFGQHIIVKPPGGHGRI